MLDEFHFEFIYALLASAMCLPNVAQISYFFLSLCFYFLQTIILNSD